MPTKALARASTAKRVVNIRRYIENCASAAVGILREMNVRPHVARNVNRSGGSAIDRRTTRHAGYEVSQRKRPLIEKVFVPELEYVQFRE